MKKIFKFLIMLLVVGGIAYAGWYFLNNDNKETGKNPLDSVIPEKPIIDFDVELEGAVTTKYYVYGRNLNIIGNMNNLFTEEISNIELLVAGKEKKRFPIVYTVEEDIIYFNISDLKNGGIVLDEFDRGEHYFFLEVTLKQNDETIEEGSETKEDIVKYVKILNDSEYPETVYYTISNVDNKITMNFDNENKTLSMLINENTDVEIYDITLDAGHGGLDGGAAYNGYKETDFTLDLCKRIKVELENYGLNVKLTRDDDTLGPNEIMDSYGPGGRAVIPKESNSKYSISVHLNSAVSRGLRGVEIYSATNIDYTLARNIVANIVSYTGTSYSNNIAFKMYDGVYSRNFSSSDIATSIRDAREKGLEPYNITTNTTYYYMIRESGGIVTGAYVDGRDQEVGGNEFYKSNVGVEGYNLEVGYIINTNDVNNIINKKDLYSKAVADAIVEYLGLNKLEE